MGLALALWAGASAAPASARPAPPERPNVVVIMSDDQTLDSMRYMPRTTRLIGGNGATFATSLVNWPLCCPSRATFLTGQYAHNHGVLDNAVPLGGFNKLRLNQTLAVWLQRAGYYTAHVGKFLNGYEHSSVRVPPGWSEWRGSKRTNHYYGHQLLEGGRVRTYGSRDENPDNPARPRGYSTDVYTRKAVRLIRRRAGSERPFFLSLAYLAPHDGGPNPAAPNQSRCDGTAKPAQRHVGAFAAEPLPAPPSFDEANVADKPAAVAQSPQLDAAQVETITRYYRCRAESLLAVDEGVRKVVSALRKSGELDRTLVVYTSDNGFFHGEHRIATGKNRVYEEATRVPLLMRGPGVPEGVTVGELAVNADLAPTILELAKARAGLTMDGRSLVDVVAHPNRLRGRELLIEQDAGPKAPDNGFYQAVRNARYVYVAYRTGEIELYDLDSDPHQLVNRAGDPAYAAAQAALARRLAALTGCAGKSCRTTPALRLALPRLVRAGGRACRRPGAFVARLRGAARRGVIAAVFRVGRERVDSDPADPLRARIPRRLLRGERQPRVTVAVELVDGRRLKLSRLARICG